MEKRLRQILEGLTENQVEWDCLLAPFTSFGIGGAADALVRVDSIQELTSLLGFFKEHAVPWRIIGKGTNLLVADAGFPGVVLLFGKTLSQIELLSEDPYAGTRLRVGAGCSLARLVNWSVEYCYTGLEFAVGIPGSLGGAVVMNAGAWGGEMADCIVSLCVVSSSSGMQNIERDELEFDYRIWKNRGSGDSRRIVLSAEICLECGNKELIKNTCRENLAQRKCRQPQMFKNAGSFFRNPQGDSAGRLIEASGLKGKVLGGAMVSDVHANFIVNMGDATALDVRNLMAVVIAQVQKDSGICLVPEVHFL